MTRGGYPKSMRGQLASRIKRAAAQRPGLYVHARRGFDLARWAARRPHEPDFEFYRYAAPAPPGRVFLDVGANTGISALCFRLYDKRTPIVSIEPNATLRTDLELVRRLIRGFEYRLLAAGEERGERTLYVPCYRGTPISGEASLRRPERHDVWWIEQNVRTAAPGDFSVIEQPVQVVPLDDLGLAPAHVKIDVEGSEAEVLRGMRRTLERHRPTILVERQEHFEQVCVWLRDIGGYEPMRWHPGVHRLVPLDPQAKPQNAFFNG
jgi:FkbM family methyltransferase